ncbi:MAG: hypothetical protein WBB34_21810 [Xanthobacteraceae bacterium]
MEKFHAGRLFDVCRVASWQQSRWKDDKTVIPEDGRFGRKDQATAVKSYIESLRPLGLSAVCATLEKMMDRFETAGCTRHEIAQLSEELIGRLIDECDDKVFFSLLPREIDYFENYARGWEIAIKRFNIQSDVEEASKCFALSRYAAAVFHSVQIVEAGLIELGTFIKVADPKSGWTAVSKTLDGIIQKPHKSRTRFEKKNFEFLEQVQGTVQGLKNAWRNKISHVQGRLVLMSADFSPEIAEEIIFATRAFIRRLAEGVPPPKAAKTA